MKESDLTELPRVTEPISAPSPLQNLVEEYNSRAKLAELTTCSLLLKDALGYFARYYSAVCVAACRELDCLPGEVAQNWSGTPNVEVALPILQECLERLKTRDERIARKLCLVFFEQDGARRAFVDQVFPGDQAQEFEISKFCMSSKQDVAEIDRESLCSAARLLDAWISASFSFFLESEQRLETGAYFGQLEQVVRFEQFTLRTGLTMRVSESRGNTALPALAPVQHQPLALAAEALTPTPEAPEDPPPGEATETAPITEEVIALAAPAPVIAPEAEALHKLMQAKQSLQQPTTSPARKVITETRFEINLEPLGFLRSSLTRKMGYGGHLWVNSIDENPIVGTIMATGGNVEVTPSFFEGTTNRVVYWVHPDDVVSSKEYLRIKVGLEERLYPLWRLAPPSRFESMNRRKMAGLLLLPGVLGSVYSTWIWYSTNREVDLELRETLRDNYTKFINATNPLSLKGAGIGQLDVNLKPQIESALLIFLMTAWLVPVMVAKLYSQFPRRDQRPLVLLFILGCCLPALYYLSLWNSSLTMSTMTMHPELAQLDYRRNFAIFLLLNGVTTIYEVFSVEGLFHRFLNELGRVALAALAAATAWAIILYQVYGLSWFG
ncbi:MAG: hypothetical protein KF760_12905 [Candidatus Eremiobacteraeota bacterium]|nr:hypothetical protein [Candidatus Eremiobacteraeota bacterium]MCW5871785.1 hypothetical protein [Candidatus Eremiobacteraeota bacterium]